LNPVSKDTLYCAYQKATEDLRLENLDQLELATTLHFKALEFGQGSVKVEHDVAFLESLV